MQAPETARDFVNRVRAGYERYAAAWARLTDAQLTAPGAVGSWSMRDVIAHVAADERWMAGQLEALQAGELPTALSCYGSEEHAKADVELTSQDQRNAWQYERLRSLSLDEVRATASAHHERLLAAIGSLRDDDLQTVLTIAPLATIGHIREAQMSEQGWPLWQWLRGVTYKHYDEHANDMRAATER